MLSIAKIGSLSYYLELAEGDYYLSGGEPPGLWRGEGARASGLLGEEVEREAFTRLGRGFDPETGKGLVQNAGMKDRNYGWDLTFSAPKSVSAAWAVGDRALREAIQGAQARAVDAAFAYIEAHAGITRRGAQGKDLERVVLTAAAFEHGTSRAQDPQLHTHLLVLNLGLRPDGTTGALHSQQFFDLKMAAGAVYRAELAHGLTKLRLPVERHRSWFELSSVPKAVLAHFSTRRAEITSELRHSGTHGAIAAKEAALTTRGKKEHLPRGELLETWKSEAKTLGLTSRKLRTLLPPPLRLPGRAEKEILTAAYERLSSLRSFREADLVRQIATEAQGRGVSGTAAVSLAKKTLARDRRFLLAHGAEKTNPAYTTRAYREAEKKLEKAIVRAGKKETHKLRLSGHDLQHIARRHNLTAADLHEVSSATAPRKLRAVADLSPRALGAASEAWRDSGYRVLSLTQSRADAKVLEKLLGEKTDTLARFLFAHAPAKGLAARLLDRPIPFDEQPLGNKFQTSAAHALGMISKREKRYQDWQKGRQHLALDRHTIVVVQNADRFTAPQIQRVLELTEKHGAKLVLSDSGTFRSDLLPENKQLLEHKRTALVAERQKQQREDHMRSHEKEVEISR